MHRSIKSDFRNNCSERENCHTGYHKNPNYLIMKVFDLIGLKSYEFKLVSFSQSLKFLNLVKFFGACNLQAHFLLVSLLE